MADNLSARLKGLIGKTVTEEDMQDLAVAIADALDAAPPPERVLPEGVLSIRHLRRTLERSAVRLSEAGWDGLAWNCRDLAAALSPDSGADPEPVQQHSPLRTWPTDPETTP